MNTDWTDGDTYALLLVVVAIFLMNIERIM